MYYFGWQGKSVKKNKNKKKIKKIEKIKKKKKKQKNKKRKNIWTNIPFPFMFLLGYDQLKSSRVLAQQRHIVHVIDQDD